MHIKNSYKPLLFFFVCNFYSFLLIGQIHLSGNSNHSFFTNSKGVKSIKGIAWQFKTEGNGAFIPLIADEVIYSGDDKGNLYAVDCETGKEIWHFSTNDKLYDGPSLKDNLAFIGTASGTIYAIDIISGKEKWKLKTNGSVCCPPALCDSLGYAMSHDKKMYIFRIINGTIKDTVKEEHIVCCTPTIVNQIVYYPDWGGQLHSRKINTLVENWNYSTQKATKWFTSPSILKDSVAYFVNNDSSVYCIDIKTGNVNWQYKPEGKVSRSPAIDGNLISFNTTDSHLYVLSSNGELLWDFKSNGVNWSHTVLDRDMVYFGTGEGYLYGFEKYSGKMQWSFKSNSSVNTPVLNNKAIYFTNGQYLTKIK